jgi:hypothetical protein
VKNTTVLQILERQFNPCLAMLGKIIQDCPDELWLKAGKGAPLWRRILHTLESIDFRFSDIGGYFFNDIKKDISAELDVQCSEILTKKETLDYFRKIESKTRRFFAALDDVGLLRISKTHKDLTMLDLILSQIRHIQLNIGYCNEALNIAGAKGVGWMGFKD